jgi:triosephosphate isomerase
MRRKLLAGNWKMNKINSELAPFFDAFVKALPEHAVSRVDVAFAVPFTLLARATEIARPKGIRIAAQNVHFEPSGAYTGEVSVGMLKDVGIDMTLIGHSERRQYFAETDASVNRKIAASIDAGLAVVVCVGETREEREGGQMRAVVTRQVETALAATTKFENFIFAYEPVWAIGTGLSATSAQAQEVHVLIRSLVRKHAGEQVAASMRILYGGSASPANISELLSQPDIDGALVGGASLKPADFAKMVVAAVSHPQLG